MAVETAPEAGVAEPAASAAPPPTPAFVVLAILGVIAVVAALYLARAFFVPLLIGILAAYALGPVVDRLGLLRIPRALGAALVLGVLVGALTWGAYSLGDGATSVIEKLPEAAREVRRHVAEARGHASNLGKIEEAAKELQGAANDAGNAPKPARPTTREIGRAHV